MEFDYHGLAEVPPRLIEYRQGWDYQRDIHAQVSAGEIPARVIFVEHEPVYTAGRRTLEIERPRDGTPVVDVDRGGKITYHGPGQLVGYPIIRLPAKVGVVDYVRRVEEALIRGLAELSIQSGRVPDRTGVWLPASATRPERKIAAIGVRVARHTTIHGFALNVDCDLGRFGNIIPCGIADAGVTDIAHEITETPSLLEIAKLLEPHLTELLAFEPYTPTGFEMAEPIA